MNFRRVAVWFVAAALATSCREQPPVDTTQNSAQEETQEDERRPAEDEIAEDCVAFVRATKVVPAQSAKDGCPNCTALAEATEILKFQELKAGRISCSGDTCEIEVTIRAAFNAAPAGTVTDGLTAWLSQEQRTAYLQGNAPAGEQIFAVKVIYKQNGKAWRAIEFDKANPR